MGFGVMAALRIYPKKDKITAYNMGFGVMAALRTYPDRYNITQRHIQLTNKAQL